MNAIDALWTVIVDGGHELARVRELTSATCVTATFPMRDGDLMVRSTADGVEVRLTDSEWIEVPSR